MKEFNKKFIREIKGATIRQKVLVIHVAIEYLVNEIIKLKLIQSPVVDDILRNLTFHNKFKLLKDNDLLDPEHLFDPNIENQKIRNFIEERRKEGQEQLIIIKMMSESETLPSDKHFSFFPFLIASKEVLMYNIRLINSIRNVYVHNFFVEEDFIQEKAMKLGPVFNSDIWLEDYNDKIAFIGANTVYLLNHLLLSFKGNLKIVEDKERGLVPKLIGISSYNFHLKKPPHWVIDKIEMESKSEGNSDFEFGFGSLD